MEPLKNLKYAPSHPASTAQSFLSPTSVVSDCYPEVIKPHSEAGTNFICSTTSTVLPLILCTTPSTEPLDTSYLAAIDREASLSRPPLPQPLPPTYSLSALATQSVISSPLHRIGKSCPSIVHMPHLDSLLLDMESRTSEEKHEREHLTLRGDVTRSTKERRYLFFFNFICFTRDLL
ncbi:unnamed protein product [Protopolystoma xenopodis]|uniref:Uncharacterized protein n=1 Tax=Protopolystoma xenopodis TaxID=117903 RepID=A0A3S5B8Q7_9PLAT|nr:unnamed protein product [Protopolystoma xenopodis]